MILATGIQFDWTINLGNLVAALSFLVLAAIAWTDLRWRVRNLETWRGEQRDMWRQHLMDADARDAIIQKMDRILYHITGGEEGRGPWIRRDDTRNDYDGPERRRK